MQNTQTDLLVHLLCILRNKTLISSLRRMRFSARKNVRKIRESIYVYLYDDERKIYDGHVDKRTWRSTAPMREALLIFYERILSRWTE